MAEPPRYPMTRMEAECRVALFDAALDYSVELGFSAPTDLWWGVYEGARHLEEMFEERLITDV